MNPTRKPFTPCAHLIRIFVVLLIVCGTPSVNAGWYVLSINGPATVEPGQRFPITAEVSGTTGVFDSMIFDVRVVDPRSLTYNGYLLDPIAFQTGSADDFSIPKGALNTGILTPPQLLGSAHFEAITRPGPPPLTFGVGTLVTLDLTMPLNARAGEAYWVEGIADTFGWCDFGGCLKFGPPLRFMVVPEPMTFIFLALGALLESRRGRAG